MKKTTLLFMLVCFSAFTSYAQDFSRQINNYLKTETKTLHIEANDMQEYSITDQYHSNQGNVDMVYINQSYNGIPVYNAMLNLTIKNGKIAYAASNLEANITSRIANTNPALTPKAAIEKAAQYLNLSFDKDIKLLEAKNSNYTLFAAGTISEEPIAVKLFLKPVADGTIKLVWEVNINRMNTGKWWNVYVDANTGAYIDKTNMVISCFGKDEFNRVLTDNSKETNEKTFSLAKTNENMLSGTGSYNVYPVPVKNPNDGTRSIVNNPADATASPYGWHDTNGMAGAESTLTQGNNVLASADTNGDNSVGPQADGTATLDFNFPLDLNQEPVGYRNASITNLFYINNMMHDVWYHYGFDEAAGNFQQNNYGNGGSAGDYVFADAQDASGTDNANFATPTDGSNPRMQMYLWNYPFIPKRLTVNTPATLAGDYTAAKPGASGTDNTNPLYYNISGYSFTWKTGDLILADDGTSNPAQDGVGLSNVEGCGDYVNPSAYAGKVVLIKRGDCTFAAKLRKAKNAGAAAALIYQRAALPTETPGTDYFAYVNMSGDSSGAPSINSQFIGKDDAATFIAEMNSGAVNVTLKEPAAEKMRDGSLETDIVSHEYTHGISTRLTGGPSNSSCLNNTEQMGEGWSDWAAFMMTLNSNSTATEALNMGDYVLWGLQLREAPYTTDMTVNGYTYAYTNQVGGEVHSIGFVWSSILWDLTWKYIAQYGYDADLYNGTGGNNKMMDVIMLAMKMQPCNPDFISGRDAILAADVQLTNGVNRCMIWEAFARRGVGHSATVGGNEAFDLPTPMPSNCVALGVSETTMQEDFVKIYPNPSKGLFNITSLRNITNAKIQVVDINGRVVYQETRNIQGTSSIDLSALKTGVYIMNINGDNFSKTEKLIKN